MMGLPLPGWSEICKKSRNENADNETNDIQNDKYKM